MIACKWAQSNPVISVQKTASLRATVLSWNRQCDRRVRTAVRQAIPQTDILTSIPSTTWSSTISTNGNYAQQSYLVAVEG